MSSDAKSFDNQVVRFDALVDSDGIEHTRLLDKNCAKSALVVVSGSPNRETDLRALTDVIFGEQRGTFDRDVTGTFVGRFHTARNGQAATIELITASNVQARRITR